MSRHRVLVPPRMTRAAFDGSDDPFQGGNTVVLLDPPALRQRDDQGWVDTPLEGDPDTSIEDMIEGEIRRVADMRVLRLEGLAWRGFPPQPIILAAIPGARP